MRQGDPISPSIFITYLQRIINGNQGNGCSISVQREKINNLTFTHDLDLLEESCEILQKSVNILDQSGAEAD